MIYGLKKWLTTSTESEDSVEAVVADTDVDITREPVAGVRVNSEYTEESLEATEALANDIKTQQSLEAFSELLGKEKRISRQTAKAIDITLGLIDPNRSQLGLESIESSPRDLVETVPAQDYVETVNVVDNNIKANKISRVMTLLDGLESNLVEAKADIQETKKVAEGLFLMLSDQTKFNDKPKCDQIEVLMSCDFIRKIPNHSFVLNNALGEIVNTLVKLEHGFEFANNPSNEVPTVSVESHDNDLIKNPEGTLTKVKVPSLNYIKAELIKLIKIDLSGFDACALTLNNLRVYIGDSSNRDLDLRAVDALVLKLSQSMFFNYALNNLSRATNGVCITKELLLNFANVYRVDDKALAKALEHLEHSGTDLSGNLRLATELRGLLKIAEHPNLVGKNITRETIPDLDTKWPALLALLEGYISRDLEELTPTLKTYSQNILSKFNVKEDSDISKIEHFRSINANFTPLNIDDIRIPTFDYVVPEVQYCTIKSISDVEQWDTISDGLSGLLGRLTSYLETISGWLDNNIVFTVEGPKVNIDLEPLISGLDESEVLTVQKTIALIESDYLKVANVFLNSRTVFSKSFNIVVAAIYDWLLTTYSDELDIE